LRHDPSPWEKVAILGRGTPAVWPSEEAGEERRKGELLLPTGRRCPWEARLRSSRTWCSRLALRLLAWSAACIAWRTCAEDAPVAAKQNASRNPSASSIRAASSSSRAASNSPPSTP